VTSFSRNPHCRPNLECSTDRSDTLTNRL